MLFSLFELLLQYAQLEAYSAKGREADRLKASISWLLDVSSESFHTLERFKARAPTLLVV